MVNENSLLEFWARNWLRGERTKDGPNYQLDMTPHYEALLVTMYNDWLAKNRKPAELAELHRMAGVADGQPVPFMRRGDHPDAPHLRGGGRLAAAGVFGRPRPREEPDPRRRKVVTSRLKDQSVNRCNVPVFRLTLPSLPYALFRATRSRR